MDEILTYAKMFAQLPLALWRFGRHTLTVDEARRIVRERMAHREENFLSMIERGVYGHPSSPYLVLLNMAGCEMGDLRAMVRHKGLNDTLRALREAGVYVTFEEFKGRRPIVRGPVQVSVSPRDFDNPFARRHFVAQTGGSTGASSDVAADLDQIAARAPHQLLTLAAHGLVDAPWVMWRGILPDATLKSILQGAYAGRLPRRWFSSIGWRDAEHWPRYGLATCYIVLWMRLMGMRAPIPRVATVHQALVVARCLAEMVRDHGRCLLQTSVSRAVRVCLAAQEAGLDLTGVTIKLGAEPATPAKVQAMARAGVRSFSNYAMTEAGSIGSGCAQPADGSDVHLFEDAYALFGYPHEVDGTGITVPAFNLTTLLPTAPKLMLNVQMDDYGVIETRRCGCLLEAHGYTTHLRQIRSYSKLTGEGVTLIGSEMERILEAVLPARFGGTPLDYQMMEAEDEQGLTRVYLTISPRVDIADEAAVVETVLTALRRSSPMADAARVLWQQADTVQVIRMEPVWTGRGKLMPLHIQRRAGDRPLAGRRDP